jgi:hypothetical protein
MQMVQFALTPGIAKINAEVFPQYPLSVNQTAMTLPSLLSMVFSLVSAFMIGKRWISKKASVPYRPGSDHRHQSRGAGPPHPVLAPVPFQRAHRHRHGLLHIHLRQHSV